MDIVLSCPCKSRGVCSPNDADVAVVGADDIDNGGLDNEREGRATERPEPVGPGDI